MDSNLARPPHSYQNDSAFLIARRGIGRRRRRGVHSILDDSNVGDVRLELGAIRVALREAALDDSLLLVFEAGSSSLIALRFFVWPAIGSSSERAIAKVLRLAIDLSRPVLIHGAAQSGLRAWSIRYLCRTERTCIVLTRWCHRFLSRHEGCKGWESRLHRSECRVLYSYIIRPMAK